MDYSITFQTPLQVLDFLNAVPDHAPNHGVELNVTPNGVTIVPIDTPNMHFETSATHAGVQPRAVLALNKHILKRMLAQGYNKIRANSDGFNAVVGEGGLGRYVAMPIHITPKKIENSIQPNTQEETKKMETMATNAVGSNYPAPVASPLDELNANIEALRNQLKTMLDESGTLIRKVKEAVLQNKQKEREYLTAKRTLERIRTASGF